MIWIQRWPSLIGSLMQDSMLKGQWHCCPLIPLLQQYIDFIPWNHDWTWHLHRMKWIRYIDRFSLHLFFLTHTSRWSLEHNLIHMLMTSNLCPLSWCLKMGLLPWYITQLVHWIEHLGFSETFKFFARFSWNGFYPLGHNFMLNFVNDNLNLSSQKWLSTQWSSLTSPWRNVITKWFSCSQRYVSLTWAKQHQH